MHPFQLSVPECHMSHALNNLGICLLCELDIQLPMSSDLVLSSKSFAEMLCFVMLADELQLLMIFACLAMVKPASWMLLFTGSQRR